MGVVALLRVYDETFEHIIMEFEVKKVVGEYVGVTPHKLIWAGVQSPVIVCKSKEPNISFALIP